MAQSRPCVLLSVAMSLDGYIDDRRAARLTFSNEELGDAGTGIGAGDPIDLAAFGDDLADRKVERLMVEGGATIHTQFLHAGLIDEQIGTVVLRRYLNCSGARPA